MTLVQQLRANGVAVCGMADGHRCHIFGYRATAAVPREPLARQEWFDRRRSTILWDLRQERGWGVRIAASLQLESVEACEHVWGLGHGPGLQPLVCEACGWSP